MLATFDLWKCDEAVQGFKWDFFLTFQLPAQDPEEARAPFRGTTLEELDAKEVHMLRSEVNLAPFNPLLVAVRDNEELDDRLETFLAWLMLITHPLPEQGKEGCWHQKYRKALIIFGDEGDEHCEILDMTKTAPFNIRWKGPVYVPDEPGEVLDFLAENEDEALLDQLVCSLALLGYKKTSQAGLR